MSIRFAVGAMIVIVAAVAWAGETESKIPVEAPVTTELAGKSAALAMPSVLRVVCTKDASVGTGFVHKSGLVVTAAHVVEPCSRSELKLVLSSGASAGVASVSADTRRDLALLKPSSELRVPALPLSEAAVLSPGDQLAAWGFPFGYRGLRPLLTVGYLAGEDQPGPKGSPSQWVVNAAFNSGNSGGPVVRIEDGSVIGVVSSKLAPLPDHIQAELAALAQVQFGVVFDAQIQDGKKTTVSEAQVVADILQYLRSQTQLVVGFAVKLGELRAFLVEQGVEP